MPNKLHSEMFMRARAMRSHERAGSAAPERVRMDHEEDKRLIQLLPHPYQEILWMRCIDGMTWDAIADATFYGKTTVRDKHRRGIKMLEEIINGKQG